MRGHDQLEIQSKRGSETGWTTIGFDTSTPFIDGREPLAAGQPETANTTPVSWTTSFQPANGAPS